MRITRFGVLLVLALALLPATGVLSPDPTPATASHVAQMSAGGMHTCVLRWTGGVKCWGRNDSGQLGNGTITTSEATPVDPVGLTSGVARISSGAVHTCALSNAGGVKCWGSGPGMPGGVASSVPADVPGFASGVASVSAGYNSTCIVTTAYGVKCWGVGMGGSTPADVSGATSGIASVSTGFGFACALTTGGGVKCWGDNDEGQLGDGQACGTTSCASAQGVVGLPSGAIRLETGENHACVVTSGLGVKCWGSNLGGQLGDGSTALNRTTPVDVVGLTSGVVAVSAENGLHTCAILLGGSAKCWGYNYFGQLGNGTTGFNAQPTPVDVIYDSGGLSAISAGGIHTCALAVGGAVACWGDDMYDQLGSDTDDDGCTDGIETGSNASAGGRRDPFNEWDFYDVNGDRTVTVGTDVLLVAQAFGPSTGPNYSPEKDRSPPPTAAEQPDPSGREPWDMGPPDGYVSVVGDILGVAKQFGHSCI
jgi:alpha-tubulin suppressor-like RCC1 family protein